ncbi:Adaptive-response sensory-kinase SasA [Comamonas sp. PE63]|uniref:histidine kinase n=1 Tax=Comamonas brasiliensis TaxID=1812482 RepID=A0ABS5LTP2_9BURK|nr:Adaptive-response sensory-kinase SasA [Comamonas sp. PE63]
MLHWGYALAPLLLIALLVFLMLQTRAIHLSDSNEIIGTLRKLKQVDAEWNVNVLRAKAGLSANHDQVASPLPLIAQLNKQLSETPVEYWLGKHGNFSRTRRLLDHFSELMEQKIAAIEHFKSQNAIFQNSSRSLPLAAIELAQAMRNSPLTPTQRQHAEEILNQILAASMSYAQMPDQALGGLISENAAALQALAQNHDLQTLANTFVALVHTMLRQQDRSVQLLQALASLPTAKAIDDLSDAQTQENGQLLAGLQGLTIYSTLLLLLLAFAGWKLLRNDQLFNQTSDTLAQANTALARSHQELRESQIQLVQSEKNSALGQMVTGIAHEITAPLAYVKSIFNVVSDRLGLFDELSQHSKAFTQAMRAPQCDQRLRNQYFRRIEQLVTDINEQQVTSEMNRLLDDGVHGIEQISEIVLNLRNFSRLDRERVTNFSVEAGLESTLQLARHLLKDRIAVHKDYGQVPEISASPSQINQVFLNLITNAAQAMLGREPPYIITLYTAVTPEGDMVQIEIQDNGSGIPDEVLPHIFDMFYTTKPTGRGSGMGLSISCKIIEEHGGRILVDTVQDAGTVFTILLPLSKAAAATDKTANRADALLAD